ncbi:hypothetical protein J7438_13305 [Thalassotalea sp. G20_0]|uniref:hypothetical protein n=1 Tax=Thalassotalea sp. G20_0 TaxID=2821093 RepID=UPI001ADAAB4F|nr:hypothetical protein [Thalassotalea sp. G20_0]MBO9495056.1 hypothetical protein [Thalassotalea sp. G20_0]
MDEFKSLQEYTIRVFDFHGSPDQINAYQFVFDRPFQEVGLENGIILNNSDECEAFFFNASSKALTIDYYLDVCDREVEKDGKVMLITNGSQVSISPLSENKTIRFESYTGGDVWLRNSESSLFKLEFQNDKRVWKEIGRSASYKTTFDANPLVRQSGPVFLHEDNGQVRTLDHQVDGELFIPLHAIDELLKSKVEKNIRPFFDWICTSCDAEIAIFLRITVNMVPIQKENCLICWVYEDRPWYHTVVTSMYIQKDKVYCHIHETVGCESDLAKTVRKKLIKRIKSNFENHSVIFSVTREAIQKDFSSCGIFAIKTVQYLSKNPERWCSFLNNMAAIKPEAGEENIRKISVSMLPAELLKLCQYTACASPEQRNSIIGHKQVWDLTLEQYWREYGYKGQSHPENHAALAKLYKSYADYAALKAGGNTQNVEVVDDIRASDSRTGSKRQTGNSQYFLRQSDPKKKRSISSWPNGIVFSG